MVKKMSEGWCLDMVKKLSKYGLGSIPGRGWTDAKQIVEKMSENGRRRGLASSDTIKIQF